MTSPALDVLLPVGSPAPRILPDPDEQILGALYAYPVHTSLAVGATHPTALPYVRANMVTSIDGAAWGDDHRSGSINNPADYRAFRVQRALADVVLVGAGTVRTEGYTPLTVPRGLDGLRSSAGCPPQIELAVVTDSGNLPDAIMRADRPPLVITSERGAERLPRPIAPERVIAVGTHDVDLAAATRELAARGLHRVLTEGGPRLLGALLQADVIDEISLTISPLVVGLDAGRIVQGFAPGLALPAHPAHLLHSDGVLLGRWLLRN